MNAPSLLIACTLIITQTETEKPDRPAEPAAQAPILIDWIHANDFSMIGLRPGIYDYHATCGYRHGFEHLRSRGVEHEYVSTGRLTPERLAGHRLLFINLVSAEREPFLVSEIAAIRLFVAEGGSLLVVTDHSNCYFHSHRLKPLFASLGIRSFTDTACEVPPHALRTGNAWLAITSFRPHPVTRGLGRLGLQAAGIVDPRHAVALTSDGSWADEWAVGVYGEGDNVGYDGNFTREEHEPLGPHGVVLAREFQKGRIVIVGDQNIWSDAFINYADNYRLWLNTMAWLLHDDELADTEPYETWHAPRVVFFEPPDMGRFGSTGNGDYYNAFCLVARHYWTFANDRLDERADLRIVADGGRDFSADEIESLSEYARSGGSLLILTGRPASSDETAQPRRLLAASLNLSGAERSATEAAAEYAFPSGGRVVVLSPEQAIPNERLATPILAPTADQTARDEFLLALVRRLLGE